MSRFEWIGLPEELRAYGKTAMEPEPESPPAEPAIVVAEPVAPPKVDPPVTYDSHTPYGHFHFALDDYEPAARHNKLLAVHVALLAPGDPVPEDPAKVAELPLHYVADTSGHDGPVKILVDASSAPLGSYSALAVCEFEA